MEIERSPQNADNVPIEDEYFYFPEGDPDTERSQLFGGMRRGGGKRRATVEKAQYYYAPVSLSRWVNE